MGRKITKELSIIIPAHNHWRLTANCLAHIFKSTYYTKDKVQIILIDNASVDMTEKFISYLVEQEEPVTYLKQTTNLDFCKSLNLGIENSDSPYIMLLNNDAFIDKECIGKMIEIIKSDSKIGIVGAMEYLPNGSPSKTKPFIYFKKDKLLDPILKDLKDLELDENTEFVDVDIVGSACCIIKKSVIDVVGKFDERFSPCMYEQEDYWLRTLKAGYRIVMPRFAKFTHIVGATTSFNIPYYQEVIKINKQRFLDKWLKENKNVE